MTIKIVTDSTCDLPKAVIAEYGITVVPLYINIGDQSYLDGIDLLKDEFYARLPEYAPLPTTAAPGPEKFCQIYEALAAKGATGILSVHVAGNLSATFNNACLGAKEMKIPVTVLDSRQLSLGTGFLAMAAARAVIKGWAMDEIIILLEKQIRRTYLFAVLDDLEFLWRSGRVNHLLAGLGSVFQIKPVFKVYDGSTSYERVRTRKQAIKRLVNLLAEHTPLEQVAIVHSHVPDRAEELRQSTHSLLPEDVLTVDVSPVIAAHVGPRAVGFVCVAALVTTQ